MDEQEELKKHEHTAAVALHTGQLLAAWVNLVDDYAIKNDLVADVKLFMDVVMSTIANINMLFVEMAQDAGAIGAVFIDPKEVKKSIEIVELERKFKSVDDK